jgi:hypothetical protein
MATSYTGMRYFSDPTEGQASFALALGMGPSPYATGCFPVRTLKRVPVEGEGIWLDDWRETNQKKAAQLLKPEPRSFSAIKAARKLAEKEERTGVQQAAEFAPPPVLDGFFLLKLCCVDDPADLCVINLADKGLLEANKEDLALFVNVAIVDAGENLLPLDTFSAFPNLRELDMPLNSIRHLNVAEGELLNLEHLDLSYNSIEPSYLQHLGILPKLKELKLSGNSFTEIPHDMTRPIQLSSDDEIITKTQERFLSLEILSLDDNALDDRVFEVLGRIKHLKELNLDNNKIAFVPHLRLVRGSCVRVVQPRHEKKRTAETRKSDAHNRSQAGSPAAISSRRSSASGLMPIQARISWGVGGSMGSQF